jgi:aryl-alcohol dehydrogenase
MKITAAVARQDKPGFSVESLDLDEPRSDEILVRIAGVGLCHTDLVFKLGIGYALPAVLGHEGSGTVEKVGEGVTKVRPGDRVLITFRSCGRCDRCATGHAAYCRTMPKLNYAGARTDGSKSLSGSGEVVAGNFFGQSSMATYALTYERNVVKVPDDVPLELMGPLGCGVQTGAGAVMRSLACKPTSSILILGGGSVGLSAVMGAKIQGCGSILVLEPHASRRALALDLGATHVIDPATAPDLNAAVRAILPQGADYALDTTGVASLLQGAVACLGAMGTLAMVGIAPPGTPMPGELMSAITLGLTIMGVIEGDSDPDVFIPELIDHYRAGRLPFDRLIKTFPLGMVNEAIEAQHRGECVKVVLIPGA